MLLGDSNPYLQLAQLKPGTVLRGRVRGVYTDGMTVDLPNHAWGTIRTAQPVTNLSPGDQIDVVLSDIDTETGRLTLKLAEPGV